ncbi:hypothetical protein BKA93DRAFT_561836 [Sparassis latifolia]
MGRGTRVLGVSRQTWPYRMRFPRFSGPLAAVRTLTTTHICRPMTYKRTRSLRRSTTMFGGLFPIFCGAHRRGTCCAPAEYTVDGSTGGFRGVRDALSVVLSSLSKHGQPKAAMRHSSALAVIARLCVAVADVARTVCCPLRLWTRALPMA